MRNLKLIKDALYIIAREENEAIEIGGLKIEEKSEQIEKMTPEKRKENVKKDRKTLWGTMIKKIKTKKEKNSYEFSDYHTIKFYLK